MFVLEYKIRAKEHQLRAMDSAIRTAQFVRNKALRYWIDTPKQNKYDLNKYSAVLAREFKFVDKLNSTARQSSAERAWSAIARFFENCKKKIAGHIGFPRFQKNNRSVEYKRSGWQLDTQTKKHITFTDKNGIGRVKLVGSRDIYFYNHEDIKRVRIVRRADGYYCQFCISIDVFEDLEPTGKAIGLDVGLKYFYVDSQGQIEENPKFYLKSEKRLKKLQRRVSDKFEKGQPPANNYKKAKASLAKYHLKISRQRVEHAKRLARCVCTSNDVVAYEDLQVRNMVKNHKLAKSINDSGWYQFRKWIEYFGVKFGKITIAVPPQYTSINCSSCGEKVAKTLSTRTHICPQCGYIDCRDKNAAINILKKGLSTVGHTGTWLQDNQNAWGEVSSNLAGENLLGQVSSVNQESPANFTV
ncbi:MAG: transposase [Hydrococcus sp. Prado102]|jgi:putative transposase|nr:transposase [Hydrococcus sp. Prado102]